MKQHPSPKTEPVPLRGVKTSPSDLSMGSVTVKLPSEHRNPSATHSTVRRDRNISVDLTPQQKAKLKKLAEASGIKVTEYLRAVVDYAITKEMKASVQFTLYA